MSFCFVFTEIDWSLTKDFFSIVGTVFGAGGVLVAGYVGINGLATWRRQLRGQDDHRLARQMLIELYKFEKLFDRCRAPAIYPAEVQRDGDPAFTVGDDERFQRLTLGFERRLDALNASYAEISVSLFEAKALWGEHILRFANRLEFLKDEYGEYVRLRLLCSDPGESDEERTDHRVYLDMRRKVFKNRLFPNDEFGAELTDVVRNLESALKLKLIS
ncbi:hypothetical protein BWR59_17230 [Pseudomonas sp. Bc-h]|uniref:hypothetical protein n=1 Tax=Pseudomonas sp. Bc-h TaxID=1943632 RepID=UPI0009D9B0B8|nr:hypothetical protein [Pseudomonas sp. Bc-h]OQR30299.1 hypothetical protein BWR59_17230 [Pseudomonas sp. Bc-h]